MRPSYRNLNAIPTHKIREILASAYSHGTDGADYGPVRHELESILYARQAAEDERFAKHFEAQQKELFKHQTKITRPSKTTTKTVNAPQQEQIA